MTSRKERRGEPFLHWGVTARLTSLSPVMLAALILAAACGQAFAQPHTDADSLRSFTGRWTCAGTFASSGRAISSTIVATWDARTQALLLHQDDSPPNDFHAIELWGASGPAGFRASISDIYSGIRWLESPGWVEDRLTWTRMEGQQPAERFVFTRPRAGSFTVEWWPFGKTGKFVLGDALVCKFESN